MFPYGSKHCLRRYLTLYIVVNYIIPQTLPKKIIPSGYVKIATENGPLVVDLLLKMVDLSSSQTVNVYKVYQRVIVFFSQAMFYSP